MAVMPLPEGAPATLNEAFAHIGTVTAPTLLDLKVMVLTESAALELYNTIATGTDNPAVAELLRYNGREEFLHAERVAQAILAISGEDFTPPQPADHPYLQDGPLAVPPVTVESLRKLAQGEFGGEALYEGWAANTANAEAARLFRLNGKEETDHGNRLMEAAALLEA
ncbi:ferritin family protein [Novosphingobium sp.]|uniref:ferritin family protein n=1 Tax=Novosphingobium sp. TaxID=1874826 RepID=UPI0035B2FB9D